MYTYFFFFYLTLGTQNTSKKNIIGNIHKFSCGDKYHRKFSNCHEVTSVGIHDADRMQYKNKIFLFGHCLAA